MHNSACSVHAIVYASADRQACACMLQCLCASLMLCREHAVQCSASAAHLLSVATAMQNTIIWGYGELHQLSRIAEYGQSLAVLPHLGCVMNPATRRIWRPTKL